MISPDAADKLESMREKSGFEFPLLMDSDLETIKAYGILNQDNGKIPHPAAVVVDREGKVTYLRVDEDYKVRPPTSSELIPALEEAAKD